MTASSKIDRIVSVCLALSTVVVVALLSERRFAPPAVTKDRAVYVKDWRDRLSAAGRPLGDTSGVVRVAVFTDFECPHCRRMDSALTALDSRFPGKISRSLVHLPIRQHQFARAAAVAFECASKAGRAQQMHHALYQAQDSLGKLTWQQFAARAGVTDTIAFSNCPVTNSQPASIAAGELQAKELDVSSTPTVLVNGWKFDPSSPDQIERAVAAAVQGKSPTSTR